MASYEDAYTTLPVPRTASFLPFPTPVIYKFHHVKMRYEGSITEGVIDDGDRTTNHQVF
jgi:hypothetical protein